MAEFLRRTLRLAALLLAVAPFAYAASIVWSETADLAVTIAFFGPWLSVAFFAASIAASILIWWLAGFIRERDEA